MSNSSDDWIAEQTFHLEGVRVSLSKPVLVERSKGFLWFPSIARLPNGDLIAKMYLTPDTHMYSFMGLVSWSGDGGLTWGQSTGVTFFGPTSFNLSNGDHVILPFELHPLSDGSIGAPHNIIPAGRREVVYVAEKAKATGLPGPIAFKAPKLGVSCLSFDGQVIELHGGGFLTTLMGRIEGEDRLFNAAVESPDGVRWHVRSVIADSACEIPGKNGPSETALCRAKDGRLMCIFRLESNMPYGQAWSDDEGRSWSAPLAMESAFSVEPRVAVMENGTILLVGGRPGLYMWINTDGSGREWERIDMTAFHNACIPREPILEPGQTTAYTGIVALDDRNLLYIYDRIPNSWNAIAERSSDTNSVWVVRVTLNT